MAQRRETNFRICRKKGGGAGKIRAIRRREFRDKHYVKNTLLSTIFFVRLNRTLQNLVCYFGHISFIMFLARFKSRHSARLDVLNYNLHVSNSLKI